MTTTYDQVLATFNVSQYSEVHETYTVIRTVDEEDVLLDTFRVEHVKYGNTLAPIPVYNFTEGIMLALSNCGWGDATIIIPSEMSQ